MSAGTRLVRALQASARDAGCAVGVTATRERAWASATFTGTHHEVALDAPPSAALAAWLHALPYAEFALPGHVVAELIVEHGAAGARVKALTLEA